MQCVYAVLTSVTCPVQQCFPTLSHQWHDLRLSLNVNCVVWFALQLPRENVFILRRNSSRYCRMGCFFFGPMPPHVLCGLRGPPSWAWQECNRRLSLGRPWGAVTLSRWCVSGDRGGWNTRRGLKAKSTNYPDHGHHGNLSLQGKIPMVELGIEPGTSWLVVRDSDR